MMTFMEVKGQQEVKCGKLCFMATQLGQTRIPGCKFLTMMTFMEVKGTPEFKCGNYVRNPGASLYDDDDPHEGQMLYQRLNVRKSCPLVTKLGQKDP